MRRTEVAHMASTLDVQTFLDEYKDNVAAANRAASEKERLQVEERIRMVNLIRDSLTSQEDVSRPIPPDSFVAYLQMVMTGDQAVLPYQRGDAEMKRLATELLQRWQDQDTRV